MCILEIRNKGAKHCYDVYVSLSEYVSVEANNRASAAKIVRKLGHEVWSVNIPYTRTKMKTAVLKNFFDKMPQGNAGDVVFTPNYDGSYFRYVMQVDGRWQHDGLGGYRKLAKTGEFKPVGMMPVYINGYTKQDERNWLKSQGFEV